MDEHKAQKQQHGKKEKERRGATKGKGGNKASAAKKKPIVAGAPPNWMNRVPQDFQAWPSPPSWGFPQHVGTNSTRHVDFYCVLDFEATCGGNVPRSQQEVIELPSVLLDVRGGAQNATVVAEFQRYCKPSLHPKLHPFCTELTGITQETINQRGVPFRQALQEHAHWLASHVNKDGDPHGKPLYSVVIVTCGDWDLATCLPQQLQLAGMATVPAVYHAWINIKRTFAQLPPFRKGGGMKSMLAKENLPLAGHHHSGIDDCRNICNLLMHLMKSGADPKSDIVER